jgi:hypothetical protein
VSRGRIQRGGSVPAVETRERTLYLLPGGGVLRLRPEALRVVRTRAAVDPGKGSVCPIVTNGPRRDSAGRWRARGAYGVLTAPAWRGVI